MGVLFINEGKIEWDIDRRIGRSSAVMQPLSVMVKIELSRKANMDGWMLLMMT